MREFPKGGIIGKTVHFLRDMAALQIPLYAANAGFFIMLSAFPALLLLLGLLRYTPLEVERLGELLSGILPAAFLEGAEELILTTYDNTSHLSLGISAAVALWSASRGIYGLMTGLNGIYGAQENRGYIRTRLICMVYTFGFLVVLLLTLALHIFGTGLLTYLHTLSHPLVRFLTGVLDLRFFLLLFLQTAVFTAMFMVLPNRKNSFLGSLPGALLAAAGWQLFSDVYSVYAERFARLQNVYGSIYAVALTMLWLYWCIAIVFYGGALNRFLAEH